MKKLFLLLIVSGVAASAFGQEAKYRKIDSLLNYLYANNKFMGSLTIREKDKVVFEKAYGFADAKSSIKATPDTKYKIGSITKMFTSAIIFQLIEEKKLTADTKLSKYYPQIKNADSITIKHLLSHQSGIFNYTDDNDFDSISTINNTKASLLKRFAAYDPDFKPGAKADYSNTNYILLGYIIEDITKKPYKANVNERIIKPLGLKNTYYFSKTNPKRKEAFSYRYGDGWEKEAEWDASAAFSAGAFVSTPNDMTRFIKALFDGKVIKKESLEQMTKTEMGYGSGIFAFPFGERRFYGHTGGIEAFAATLGYYPKDQMGFSLLINGENYDYNDIVIGILSCYYKIPYTFPNLVTVDVDNATLKSYEGDYTSPSIPLVVTIKEREGRLVAMATGQGEFYLNAISPTEFTYDAAQIKMTFTPGGFRLEQGSTVSQFTKK